MKSSVDIDSTSRPSEADSSGSLSRPRFRGMGRQETPRFRLLDGLRLVAALAVVVYHFTARENNSWGLPVDQVFPELSKLSAFGALGVQLFFIISGFVILLSAWGRSVPAFVGSRAGRLFPGYWAGVVLTGFLLLVLWPKGKDIGLSQVIVNLTMLQETLGVHHVDGVYWTLWVELKFYLLIGVFLLIGITRTRIIAFCAVWPVIASLAETLDSSLLEQILMPDHAPLFAGGMLLYLIHREGWSVTLLFLLGLNVIFAAQQTATGHFLTIGSATGHSYDPIVCWVIVSLFFALVASATLSPLSRLNWPLVSSAGALTYPLYLIHEYWGWWFISLLAPTFPHRVVLVVAIVLCLVMSWAIWKFVEKPVGPHLRRAIQAGLEKSANRDSLDRLGGQDFQANDGHAETQIAVSRS